MDCETYGERMIGDVFMTIIHCPNAEWETWIYSDPDGKPVYCEDVEEPQ